MRIALIAALIAGGLAAQASGGGRATGFAEGATIDTRQKIIVSCFRGPWDDVIWDRPNSKFVESLVDVGYDYPTAHAIAERVCRDDRLVGNPEGLRREMIRIYHESPARP